VILTGLRPRGVVDKYRLQSRALEEREPLL
jgi:hypothetical protein